jgi:general nucleoside transport system permease protein
VKTEAQRATGVRQRSVRRALILTVLGGLVLVLVERGTGAEALTSSGTFGAALRLGMPILLAGLGALYAERAGVVNIGLEGMMILGTWFGAWAGWKFGPWEGVAFAVLGGAAGGLIHAIATVTFGIDHIVSGVAINFVGFGVARFLSVITYSPETGGSATQSPEVRGFISKVNLPFFAGGELFGWRSPDLFGWLERKHWFFVSDVGALIRGLTGNISWLTIIAAALVPLSFWLLWRTSFGLRLRSAGEHPVAAESLGVPVYAMKYVGVIISGALAGMGGAFLVLEAAGIYLEGQTNGRGFIGLAALIFGNWRPGGVGIAAALFGYADALELRQERAVHGLLLFIALGLALLAVWLVVRRRLLPSGMAIVVAGLFLAWYLATKTIPTPFVAVTPHIVTLVVLAVASQRLRPPAADGRPYRKGQTQ